MKKILFILTTIVGIIISASARDFTYMGITYTVLDEDSKTCQTRNGFVEKDIFNQPTYYPGNYVEGILNIPQKVFDGNDIYKVEGVGDYSFIGNPIQYANFESVKNIGKMAFYDCPLGAVIVGDNHEEIGINAFGGTSTYRIATPEKFADKFYNPFIYDPVLTYIYDSMLITKDGSELLFAEGNLNWDVEIPEGITKIHDYAFAYCHLLPSITLPSSLTAIGDNAFQQCYELKFIDLPHSLVSIGSSAFQECKSLKNIYLPASLELLGNYCFYDCSNLQCVKFSGNLSTIPSYSFANCQTLNEITFNDNITTIEERAFMNCSSLEKIQIPSSIIMIGTECFKYCLSLSDVEFVNQDEIFNLADNSLMSTGIFSGCSSLKKINLPAISEVPISAFENCKSLTSITLPESLIYIGAGGFSGSGLTKVSIPASVQQINYGAFANCESLKEVFINSGDTSIGNDVFLGDNDIEAVYYNTYAPQNAPMSVFSNGVYTNAVLFVPDEALNKIAETIPWNRFEKVSPFDFSGIKNILYSDPVDIIITLDGIIYNSKFSERNPSLYIKKKGNRYNKILK